MLTFFSVLFWLVDPSSPAYRLGRLIGQLFVLGLLAALYVLPTILAVRRRSTLTLAVVLIDFFLGWTVAGWVVALTMALASGTRVPAAPAASPVVAEPPPALLPAAEQPLATPPTTVRPDAIEWTGGPALRVRAHPTDFMRSPARVAILNFLAPGTYELWWFWQFFKMARREAFPRARAFWWIFVPIYGLIVIYRAFEDLERRLPAPPSPARFNAAVVIALVIASTIVGGLSVPRADLTGLLVFLLGSVLFAAGTFMVQRGANAYLAVRYPQEQLRGMTWGEIVATVLGFVLLAGITLGSLLPAPA